MVGVNVTIVENSTLVKTPVRSIYSHSQGSSSKHFLDGGASSEISNALDVVGSGSFLAILVDCLVWVISCGCLSIVSDILESSKGKTSVATVVVVGRTSSTVDKLLLWEVDSISSTVILDLVAFVGSSGSESPAWSALSLISDISDDSFVSPIDLSIEASIHGFFNADNGLICGKLTKISGDELFLSEVWELVDSDFPVLLRVRVMSFHLDDILSI